MRIGVISDLHIDQKGAISINDYENVLVDEVLSQSLELLLIAGDVSNHHKKTQKFISNIREALGIPVLFVPGNHDYWSEDGKDTYSILEFFKAQEESIIEKPYVINDEWAIVGHSGWYDYTFADKRFTVEELSERTFNGRVWKDKLNVNWQLDDRTVSERMASIVKKDLEKVKDKKIILMSHIVTYQGFGVPLPNAVFDYFNAFIGTSDYDTFFEEYPIKYNIMGHVHYRKRVDDGITHICACLGNQNEWKTNDLKHEVNHALQILEI